MSDTNAPAPAPAPAPAATPTTETRVANHRQAPAPAAPRPRRGTRLLAVGAVVAAVVLATASTDENEPARVDESGATTEDGAQPDVFAVGDLVELGAWQVRVHAVTDPLEPTNEFLTPAAGNRWVAVDTEVTNTSAEPQTVSSLMCFEISDDQNRGYTLALTADAGAATPDGEVAAGGSRRGTLTYEVPADAAGLRLVFKCDLFSTGSATIALG